MVTRSGNSTPLAALQLAPAVGSLDHAVGEYLTHKQVRLSTSSYRGYSDTLKFLCEQYPTLQLADLAPPNGTILLEDFLAAPWGKRAGRTYNKHLSVLRDFCRWQFVRGHLVADLTPAIEKARVADIPHDAYTKDERARILAVNPGDREQIAIRLLLDYGLRKGSVLAVRLDSFDTVKHAVSFWMKGARYRTVSIPADSPIWRHLSSLLATEPGHHYLLPRRVVRRRTRPQAKELSALAERIEEARAAAALVTDDYCTFEIGWTLSALDNAAEWQRVADDSACHQVVQLYLDEPMGVHAMHDLWYRWLERAGIVDKGVTRGQRIHKARKTAGQRVLEATGDITSVKQLLGHHSVATTERYVQPADDRVRRDLERTIPTERVDEALMRQASATLHIGSRRCRVRAGQRSHRLAGWDHGRRCVLGALGVIWGVPNSAAPSK